jgi:hypothetical protein
MGFNLVDIAQGLQGILNLFAGSDEAEEPWAQDEGLFADHFGITIEEFAGKLALLSVDQQNRYQKTLEVNPEAAVLWVSMMQQV